MTFRYDFVPTPLGEALVILSDDGLATFDLLDGVERGTPWLLEGVSRRLGALPELVPGAADETRALLDAYFEGEPVRFHEELRLDWRLIEGFPRQALQAICEIPWGETASYGEVAVHAGSPGAARAVGTACRLTPFSIVVPVHRVVRADGSPGQYGAHPEHKLFLLDLEKEAARSRVSGV